MTTSPSDDGFTLVEVMMAMLIMTVGLFGLLQCVSLAYEHNARNKVREEAVELAEEQMNDLRVLPFDNITANYSTQVRRNIAGGFRNFSVTKGTQAMPVEGSSKKLTIAVGWRFKNVRTEHVIYTMKNR